MFVHILGQVMNDLYKVQYMLFLHCWTASLSCTIGSKHHKASGVSSYFIFLAYKVWLTS